MQRTQQMIEACGYEYRPPPDVVSNSHKALEVTELARSQGLHEQVHTRLMEAYWSEAADLSDEDTLLTAAEQAGLDRETTADALATGAFAQAVQDSTKQAHQLGINAIPAFVLDQKMLLLGAHPEETFEQAFDQLAELAAAE